MNSPIKKVLGLAIWIPTVFETLAMVGIGLAKFTNWAQWSGWFEGWGYGAWFAAVIGIAEILGGLALLVPRLAAYAASGLLIVMLGALYTTTTKPNELGWTGAAIHIALLAVILASRWPLRWRPKRANAHD
ncbi:MAG: DoxX family protein [Gemmatimonadota bacterium]